jgi:hypothetical protein
MFSISHLSASKFNIAPINRTGTYTNVENVHWFGYKTRHETAFSCVTHFPTGKQQRNIYFSIKYLDNNGEILKNYVVWKLA